MPKLTDTEKAEIARLLQQDKPLPDHYRFLLFDDKREVELVWNGKTAEVCNVVLPFQTIEQIDQSQSMLTAATSKGQYEISMSSLRASQRCH